jgi:hypothetical protein
MLQKGLRNNFGKSHFFALFNENNREKTSKRPIPTHCSQRPADLRKAIAGPPSPEAKAGTFQGIQQRSLRRQAD